jgi:hypothetical protein
VRKLVRRLINERKFLRIGLAGPIQRRMADVKWVGEPAKEQEYLKLGVTAPRAKLDSINEDVVLGMNVCLPKTLSEMTRGWAYCNEAADGRVSEPAAACYPVAVHESSAA